MKHKTQKVANLKLVHYFLHDHNNFQFSIVDGVVACDKTPKNLMDEVFDTKIGLKFTKDISSTSW